jgi:hypothetical protein
MSDARRPLSHLLAGIEELLRAGADATAILRGQADAHGSADAGAANGWSELVRRFADQGFADEVRAALEREAARWELRSDEDPAAARVRDLFRSLADLLEAAPHARSPAESAENVQRRPEDRARAPGTRAPRRGVPR